MVRAIGNDNDSNVEPNDHFTPDAATKMLPLVRVIVEDMVRLQSSIDAQREQLGGVDDIDTSMQRETYQEEIRDIRESIETDESRLQSCISELALLGVRSHDPVDGCVDFPAMMHRNNVRLCWKLKEDVVCHWHDVNKPQDRRPIDS